MFVRGASIVGFTWGFVNNATGSALTGASAAASAYLSKDGAAASVLAAAASELSNGLYKVNLSAAETTACILGLSFTSPGAVPVYFTIKTVLPDVESGSYFPAVTNSIAASATADIADATLDRANGIETGYTLRKALRLMLSALAGKVSGASTTTVTVRDIGDSVDRIVATVDAYGDRSAITYTAS